MRDSVLADFMALARASVPEATYASCYWATVVKQDGDSIDVRPDDQRVPPMQGVRLTVGVPGVKVNVAAGARVLVGWSGGDPRFPYVHGWDQSENAIKVSHVVAGKLELGGEGATDPVTKALELMSILSEEFAALAIGFTACAAITMAPASPLGPPVNAAAFTALATQFTSLAARLQSIASTKVFVDR